jgi:riboflavin transporter FmnP
LIALKCIFRAIFYFEVCAMNNLWTQLQDNLLFVGVCALIIAGLILLAKLAERFLPARHQVTPARRVSIIGICGAIAAVLHILDFPLLFIAPEFYKLDFSELPVMLCGFYLGPSAAVVCQAIKIVLKLLLKGTSTAFVGDLANFVVGCALVLPAVIIYHTKKSKKSALIGLLTGTLSLTVFGTAFNAIYLIPQFSQLYGIPMEAIISMGTAINGNISDLVSFVILCVAPLNLIKGLSCLVLTMLLYKRVARPLFGK